MFCHRVGHTCSRYDVERITSIAQDIPAWLATSQKLHAASIVPTEVRTLLKIPWPSSVAIQSFRLQWVALEEAWDNMYYTKYTDADSCQSMMQNNDEIGRWSHTKTAALDFFFGSALQQKSTHWFCSSASWQTSMHQLSDVQYSSASGSTHSMLTTHAS